MSDLQSENSQESSSKNTTPSKRTPTKRLSKIEKAQLESVEVIKNMGGSLDVEGGRKTRSSARSGNTQSTPRPVTPPPAKKPRKSSSSTPRRGRPKKNIDDQVKDGDLIDEIKETPGSINDDDSKKDETVVGKPDNDVTAEKKSDKLEEESTGTEENENENSKKLEDKISNILPSTEEITEKSEIDSSSDVELIEENNVEEKKNELLSPPEVVVTAPTPEKSQQSTNNVPEKKLDQIEPMEVDSSIEDNDKNISVPTTITNDETTVQPSSVPTKCNSTSSITDKNIIENNLIENKEKDEEKEKDVQVVNTSKIENSKDEITNIKSVIQCNNVANDKVNDERATIIPQNDNKINSIVENDKEHQPSNENKIVAESDDKKENDSCEPKISSPPPSDGITQPQTCN